MDQKIVGLSGFARAGKDETAAVLVNEFGFTRIAFADKLRDFLYALNPIVDVKTIHFDFEDELRPRDEVKTTHVQQVIDNYGWNGYKETEYGTEIRRLLQRLGTEAGRQTLWDTIWIDSAFTGIDAERVVVTDARFINEFDAVKSRGGSIWRVNRAGVGPANEHASEMEALSYQGFDLTLHNDSTLEAYQEKVRNAALKWGF